MAKRINLNLEDAVIEWVDAAAKETAGRTRTDVIQAIIKAEMIASRKQVEEPVAASVDHAAPQVVADGALNCLLFTLDMFFQRYITDHPDPDIDMTADERWKRFEKMRSALPLLGE